ncbi:MAG: glucosyl-dolichyl phosphate glucuronosyltransferase, partial [Actinomycetota bacterium]|nr:glucosyl-dolichyl phosphate glucuronosyltransferase [Actinomycetota bacterium]
MGAEHADDQYVHRTQPTSVSVVICTRNRAHLLPRALGPLAAEVAGDDEAEVLVVDSASTDATCDVVHDLTNTVPSLRYHRLAAPGLSLAREAALAEARHEVVAFLDDDAVVHPGWLGGVREGFEDGDVAAVGGPIVLEWTGRRPRWMSAALEQWYSGLDHGPAARDLGGTEYLWGANLAVRRSAASAVGGFGSQLGRIGSSLLSGEDIDL